MNFVYQDWLSKLGPLVFLGFLYLMSPLVAQAEPGVTNDEILLGQTTSLTGPLAELGTDTSIASKAYFDFMNSLGGVNGRKIRLITLDDAYDTTKAVENAKFLIRKEKVFALFNILGTAANMAVLPLISDAGIPSIAPLTGAKAVREPFNKLIFNVRAGFAEETEKIIEHLGVRGVSKIGVVYQNNPFGRDGLASINVALAKRKLTVDNSVTIENDASDAAKAAMVMLRSHPKAIVMIMAGKPTIEFIKEYNKLESNMQFFALSSMGTQTSVVALGKEGAGVVVAQIAPLPFSATSGIAQEYQKVMKKMGVTNWSSASMEGFINAKITVEGLKRAGRDLTRQRFITGLESISNLDLDGYVVNFSNTNHQGSRYVELTVISRNGRLLH